MAESFRALTLAVITVMSGSLLSAPPTSADAAPPVAVAQTVATVTRGTDGTGTAEDADGIEIPPQVIRVNKKQPAATATTTSCSKSTGLCVKMGPSSEIRTAVRPTGGTTTSAAMPDRCYSLSPDTTPGGRYFEWEELGRKVACFHVRYFLMIFNYYGEVVGRSTLDIALRTISNPVEAEWDVDVDASVWNVVGIGAPTSITLGTAGYYGKGLRTGVTSWGETSNLYWSGHTYISRPGLAAKQIVTAGGFWYFTVGSYRWVTTQTRTIASIDSRCDRYRSLYKGCVYSDYPGRMVYGNSMYPEFTKHVKAAMKSGLPGGVGSGTYLNRITSATDSAKNGATACPPSLTRNRPKGTQCDEYPFRSVKQGAWTNGTHVARTFSWCRMPGRKRTGKKGFSRCFINGSQNAAAGSLLGQFYLSQHILNGDKFQVGFN